MKKNKTKTKKEVTRSFYLVVIASGAFGAILALCTIALKKSLTEDVPRLYTALQQLSPWIFLFLAAFTLLFSLWFLRKARKTYRCWEGEEEDSFFEEMERFLNWALGISNVGTILLITWFGLVAVSAFQGNCNVYFFLLIAFLLVAAMILLALIQRKCVEQEKLINPEKKGDALDIRFQKDWIESCDEQEQLSIYRASYKAFTALPITCLFLFVVLVLFLPYSDIGFLPFFCVGLLWMVPTVVYLRETALKKRMK